MRRISLLLIPLFVILLPTAAHAIDHWGGRCSGLTPPGLRAVAAALGAVLLMVILAWLLTVVLPGTNLRCAFFVAVASVAATILFVEYIFITFFHTWTGTTAGLNLLGAILKFVFLLVIITGGASCCLGKPGKWGAAAIVALVITVLSELLAWVIQMLPG